MSDLSPASRATSYGLSGIHRIDPHGFFHFISFRFSLLPAVIPEEDADPKESPTSAADDASE